MSRTLSFINDNSNNINSIVSHIVGIFQQCSSVCLKESKGKVSTLRPQWFVKKCRDYKRAKLSYVHNFRVNSSETNLNKYVQSKKEFKDCCNHKKRLFYKTKLDDLCANINNPKSFWKKLKNLSGTNNNENSICSDDWKLHFETLFTANANADNTV